MDRATLKQLLNFTSIEWKGFYTSEEIEEMLNDFECEIEELKEGKEAHTINCFCENLLNDIYGNIEDVENVNIKSIEEFEKIVNQYNDLIVKGGLNYSKLIASNC